MYVQGVFEPEFQKHAWAGLELRILFPYPHPLSLAPGVGITAGTSTTAFATTPVFCDVKCISGWDPRSLKKQAGSQFPERKAATQSLRISVFSF